MPIILTLQKLLYTFYPSKKIQHHLAKQVMAYWCVEDELVHEIARLKGVSLEDYEQINKIRTVFREKAKVHEYNLSKVLPTETQASVLKYCY